MCKRTLGARKEKYFAGISMQSTMFCHILLYMAWIKTNHIHWEEDSDMDRNGTKIDSTCLKMLD